MSMILLSQLTFNVLFWSYFIAYFVYLYLCTFRVRIKIIIIIEVTRECLLAASCSIPSTERSDTGSKKVPGWTELVEPHRFKSLCWHDLWVDCSKPVYRVVAGIIRRTRSAYHLAVQRVKRHESDIVNDRFASALLENRSRDHWSEVKRIKNNSTQPSNVIDGLSTPEKISNYFA